MLNSALHHTLIALAVWEKVCLKVGRADGAESGAVQHSPLFSPIDRSSSITVYTEFCQSMAVGEEIGLEISEY
ncbi:hypothetical protein GDO78_004537 [Eleutherodactylus coqui]|uniref:Uncharacterized protein n=1 Tax=Eleutherodactylus coqui TaxID=57060 RepID=A0A8J6JZY5_ELECQ|nr:hypothetical protein GDO78_004537 [Eleutherodactylus coqui]